MRKKKSGKGPLPFTSLSPVPCAFFHPWTLQFSPWTLSIHAAFRSSHHATILHSPFSSSSRCCNCHGWSSHWWSCCRSVLAAIAATSQLPGDGAAQLEVISSLFSSLLLWVITIIGEDGHHQPHLSASSSSPVSLSIAIIISSSNILLFLFIASRTFPCFSRPHQAQLLPHCIDRRSSSSSFFFLFDDIISPASLSRHRRLYQQLHFSS